MKTSRLVIVLLSILLAFITIAGSPNPAPARTTGRTLSMEERHQAQRAIEEVYWNHRLWPKENPGDKPPLDAVLSDAQIQERVEDYLKKSKALEELWGRPIASQDLQAEMERILARTRMPDMLREMSAALKDDPFLIAETLAQQTLVDRLIRGGDASDVRYQSDPRQQAKAILTGASGTRQLFGMGVTRDLSIWGLKQSGETIRENYALSPQDTRTVITASLEGRYLHTAIGTGAEMIIWGGLGGGRPLDDGWRHNPLTDAWVAIPTYLEPRCLHTAVWTGSEMIIWGGASDTVNVLQTGGRYNPMTDTWVMVSTSGAPSGRAQHTAVWTGSEMIIWGGVQAGALLLNDGSRYNPSTDTWEAVSLDRAPTPRRGHTAIWTGSGMIVWGGTADPVFLGDGGYYNPLADTWEHIANNRAAIHSEPNGEANRKHQAPSPRYEHTAVWTGNEMIVWGGYGDMGYLGDGGRYDPFHKKWTRIASLAAPAVRFYHSSVWTGDEMIVWGGINQGTYPQSPVLGDGARYDPIVDRWASMTEIGAPLARALHSAVWTGGEMIVWGGTDETTFYGIGMDDGGRYNPSTNTWIRITSGMSATGS